MTEHSGEESTARLAVGMRVCAYTGTDEEGRGVVVEDFGDLPYSTVEVGGTHIADPARRWAVMLDTGTLLFVDSEDLVAE